MLIKTIIMETSDDQLFSKTSPLLPAGTELAFHTVNCSALNAEELRREEGIEVRSWLAGGAVQWAVGQFSGPWGCGEAATPGW